MDLLLVVDNSKGCFCMFRGFSVDYRKLNTRSLKDDKEVTRGFIFHQKQVKRLIESYSKKVTKVETGAFRLTAVLYFSRARI